MLQFLKSRGIVLTKVYGDKQQKVGWKDAPKTVKKKRVITNTPEELGKFFGACGSFKQWATFQTLRRAGLREAELITTRVQDVVLDAAKACIDVCARTVDGFEYVPKWYAERQVNIDSDLAETLREVKKTAKGGLMFGTASGHVNLHLLRECKRIAERAGLPPERFRLHRFRANYATHCLRQGMDLETLREQLGHRDTESLRCYIDALKGEQRAEKVERVWSDTDKVVPITWKQRKVS
jgi:integrase